MQCVPRVVKKYSNCLLIQGLFESFFCFSFFCLSMQFSSQYKLWISTCSISMLRGKWFYLHIYIVTIKYIQCSIPLAAYQHFFPFAINNFNIWEPSQFPQSLTRLTAHLMLYLSVFLIQLLKWESGMLESRIPAFSIIFNSKTAPGPE